MTFAIEPMINIGSPNVVWMDDEWTVVTEDESLSAHYENTIAITDEGCEILTMLPEEKEAFKELIDRGVEITAIMTPTDPVVMFKEYL